MLTLQGCVAADSVGGEKKKIQKKKQKLLIVNSKRSGGELLLDRRLLKALSLSVCHKHTLEPDQYLPSSVVCVPPRGPRWEFGMRH